MDGERYISARAMAKKWGVSERSVRNYCSLGKVAGAMKVGKGWYLLESSIKPLRLKDDNEDILTKIKLEHDLEIDGGIYYNLLTRFTYETNAIEGINLDREEVESIYDSGCCYKTDAIDVDDIIEVVNHFYALDLIIQSKRSKLSELFIKDLHRIIEGNTYKARRNYFVVGDYKKTMNVIGDIKTSTPAEVEDKMKKLLLEYNNKEKKTLEDLLDFHYKFERIHPFTDGNGRVGRLILLHECLRHKITPFIFKNKGKLEYYRGLNMWEEDRSVLINLAKKLQEDFLRLFRKAENNRYSPYNDFDGSDE